MERMLIICIFLVQHGRKSTREYQTLLLIALHDSYHFFCVLCAHTLLIQPLYTGRLESTCYSRCEKVNNIPSDVRT